MSNFNINPILYCIKDRIEPVKYEGTLSDVGNELGLIIGKYAKTEQERDDLIRGLIHGMENSKNI